MITLGIRASAKKIYYTIIDDKDNEFDILTIGNILIPQALTLPDRLCFVKTNVASIIKEFKVVIGGIRICELIAIKNNIQSSIERCYYEGVILELFSDCTVNYYFEGRKQFIASALGEKTEKITEYINGLECYEIGEWHTFSKEIREAILIALASSTKLASEGVVLQ